MSNGILGKPIDIALLTMTLLFYSLLVFFVLFCCSFPPLHFQVLHQYNTSLVLHHCTRARVAVPLPQAYHESLYQPINKQHLHAQVSHWRRVYLNNNRLTFVIFLAAWHFTFLLLLLVVWFFTVCTGYHSGSGGGAWWRGTKTGQLFVHPRWAQSPREAAECRQCRVSQVTASSLIFPTLVSIKSPFTLWHVLYSMFVTVDFLLFCVLPFAVPIDFSTSCILKLHSQ